VDELFAGLANHTIGPPVATVFYSRIRAGSQSLLRGGSPIRDFVHVSDVVRANLLGWKRRSIRQLHQCWSGEGVTIRNSRNCWADMRHGAESVGPGRVSNRHIHARLPTSRSRSSMVPAAAFLQDGMAGFVRWAEGQQSLTVRHAVEELERVTVRRRSKL